VSEIILASGSPRRKEMLEWLGLDFEVVTSNFDEECVVCDDADELAEELALQKALVVANQHPESLVIAGDTVVSVDDQILGKATDKDHAKVILRTLSGRGHEIITGVVLVDPFHDQPIVFHEKSQVFFREVSDSDIETYLETDIWKDKAGAYAIQEDPHKLVLGFDGSFTNIMGLPLTRLSEELVSLGVNIPVDVISTIEANTGKREI